MLTVARARTRARASRPLQPPFRPEGAIEFFVFWVLLSTPGYTPEIMCDSDSTGRVPLQCRRRRFQVSESRFSTDEGGARIVADIAPSLPAVFRGLPSGPMPQSAGKGWDSQVDRALRRARPAPCPSLPRDGGVGGGGVWAEASAPMRWPPSPLESRTSAERPIFPFHDVSVFPLCPLLGRTPRQTLARELACGPRAEPHKRTAARARS